MAEASMLIGVRIMCEQLEAIDWILETVEITLSLSWQWR